MWIRFGFVPFLATCLLWNTAMPCRGEEAKTPAEPLIERDSSEASAEAAPSNQAIAREREFRRAEQTFVNLDYNSNCVIDVEEWTALFEEKRGLIPKEEWEQKPEKLRELDADKNGTLSDEEVDRWLRLRYEARIKRYVKSEVFKSRKAEFEKRQAGK
jgi:hypothetical protein